jgi:hypothetical protein
MTTPNERDTGSLISSTDSAGGGSDVPEDGADRADEARASRDEASQEPATLSNPQGAHLPPSALAENPDRERPPS